MAAEIDKEKCTGCISCADVCPAEAITFEEGKAVVDEEECLDCGLCVRECPTSAITVE